MKDNIRKWNKEEKISLAEKLFLELGVKSENIILSRVEELNIDICSPTNNQRGTAAIIIGDDGTYLICGSIKPLESYITDYKNGQRSNFEKNNVNFYENKEELIEDDELKKIKEDVIYEKRKLDEYIEKDKNTALENQRKLEKIKEMFFTNNPDFFDEIKMYLNETLDYNILNNPTDNCIRFEIFDKNKTKKLFFAINKNLFVLNDLSEHKLNLRGNSSNDIFSSLICELDSITKEWSSCYSNDGEYYWGLTICKNNKCNLYVGNSSFPRNWSKFIKIINDVIKNLTNRTHTEMENIYLDQKEELKLNTKEPFELSHLKYTKYHWMSGAISDGCPITTSIEINREMLSNKWKVNIIHKYMLAKEHEEKIISHQYDLPNQEIVLKTLENNDLRNLKNNYFSDDKIESYSHWEVEYNYYFKIAGTFDLEPDEIKEVVNVLNCNKIIEEELLKVEKKFNHI